MKALCRACAEMGLTDSPGFADYAAPLIKYMPCSETSIPEALVEELWKLPCVHKALPSAHSLFQWNNTSI